MPLTLWQEFYLALHEVSKTIIPYSFERTPIDGYVLSTIIPIHFLPVVFMAYLARRPDTYLIRLLLLPLCVVSCLHAGFAYYYVHPMLKVYNFGLALCSMCMLSKVIFWALTPEGILKRNETAPSIPRPPEMNGNGHAPPAVHSGVDEVELSFDLRPKVSSRPPKDTLWKGIVDAMELMWTLRGQDFTYSDGLFLPAPKRPQAPRSAFLKATAKSFAVNFLVLDILEALIKLSPGVGDVDGGSIYIEGLTPIPQYMLATVLHFMTGVCLLTGFQMVFDLLTLLVVLLLNVPPSYYPPVMDRPFGAESLHDFWAKRWHQLLRQTFIVLGGWPVHFICTLPLRPFKGLSRQRKSIGDLALLFGTFLGSGIYHETSIYAMGKGNSMFSPTVIFFAAQAPLLVLERLWRSVTGRRVGGWLGTAWVWLVIVGGAQGMVDEWHRHGLGGGMVIFPFISPARLFLLPLILRLVTLIR